MAEASRYAGILRSAARVNMQAPSTGDVGPLPTRSDTALIRLGELSQRADDILATHWQRLFGMGLAMQFNSATLASKYWTPLPLPGGAPVTMFRHTLSHCSQENLDLLDISLQLGHGCLDHLVEGATVSEPSVKR